VVASRPFLASSVELRCDRGVGEAGFPLELARVVVSLVVATADWAVGLGTYCVTDALGFWLMLGVTVLSIGTIDSLTVRSFGAFAVVVDGEVGVCLAGFGV